tara:strand:- start:309 stop:503 length:195 start_codon:yes stop_codon:yes gene_type:complete
MFSDNIKGKINIIVEKGAYAVAGFIALGFLWLVVQLLGVWGVTLLIGMFIILAAMKLWFIWFCK